MLCNPAGSSSLHLQQLAHGGLWCASTLAPTFLPVPVCLLLYCKRCWRETNCTPGPVGCVAACALTAQSVEHIVYVCVLLVCGVPCIVQQHSASCMEEATAPALPVVLPPRAERTLGAQGFGIGAWGTLCQRCCVVVSRTVLPAAAAAAAGVCSCLLVGRKAHRSMLVSAEKNQPLPAPVQTGMRLVQCLPAAVCALVCKQTACALLSAWRIADTAKVWHVACPCICGACGPANMLRSLAGPSTLQQLVLAQHHPLPGAVHRARQGAVCHCRQCLSLGCSASTDC